MTEPEQKQSLDLIGQLLSRSRRWEFVGAAVIILGAFSAGSTFIIVKGQFAALTVNQEALKAQLLAMTADVNSRTAERHANEAAVDRTDVAQSASITALQDAVRGVAASVTQLAEAQRDHELADRERDKELSDVHATQIRIGQLLDLMIGDRLRDSAPTPQPGSSR